jgi:cellulose synthase/poly-beta-1,6-N-acetylglucosamine synthase-like glycosyltransferase
MLVVAWRVLRFQRSIQFLSAVPIAEDLTPWPKVSLIIPACNEAATIASAVDSLLSMDYPNLELIVVEDRSTDGTDEVVQQLVKHDSRIHVVTVSTLPSGWLGKVHALYQGVQAASGEWLLFSDADVHYQRQSLKKAISYCRQQHLDFLAVTPAMVGGSFPLRILVAHFFHWASITVDPDRVRDPQRRECIGTGAFNLVQRAAYDRSRGFEWLKMEVIDDSALACELKESQARTDVLSGLDEIELEWYPTVWAFVRGLEKNGFAVFQYSLLILALYVSAILAIFIGFTVAPFLAGNNAVIVFVAICLVTYMGITAASVKSLMRISPMVVLCFPFTFVLMPWVIVRSAVLCIFQRGIYWRRTFYPLAQLRDGQRVKVFQWMIETHFKKPSPVSEGSAQLGSGKI